MARRVNRHLRPHRPLAVGRLSSADDKVDGRWVVTSISADRASKEYRCPGCDQVIAAGVAHLVVWPHTPQIGASSAVAERRHWHRSCWQRRR